MQSAAKASDFQPYYAIWFALTDGGPNWGYMAWIGRQWRAFDRAIGISQDQRGHHRAAFLPWLRQRHTDTIALRVIEGHLSVDFAAGALGEDS